MIVMEAKRSKIYNFWKSKKRMPTYSEVATIFGFRSKNSAFKFIQKLINEGLVAKDSTGALIPGPMMSDVPLLGLVEAGFPSSAEELKDTMDIDSFLIERRDATFMLKVKGESMRDAGILDGDFVLVERRREPKDGDIVIACVDGDWTMKYLRYRKGLPQLVPANDAFPVIIPERDLKIEAVVISVVRKYR